MRFPSELWEDARDAALALATAEGLAAMPLVLTDRLTNAVFFNEEAEAVFGDRAEALVNRTTLSLLGFSKIEGMPAPLVDALLAKGEPWRGVAVLDVSPKPEARFVEASAVHRGDRLVCGLLRIGPKRG